MKKQFTDEAIVRYLYDEMEPAEHDAFVEALCTDEQLWQRYELLQETVAALGQVQYEPSEVSLQAIRTYVRHSAPDQTGPIQAVKTRSGFFRMHLNSIMLLTTSLLLMVAVWSWYLPEPAFPATVSAPAAALPDAQNPYAWEDPDLEATIQYVQKQVTVLKNQQSPAKGG
ncbi:MAG: hypothetical protein SF053_03925 [Bacteroidia bacterium]|nr:hypothetical protein [Bacteroidia bacterium]